MNDDRPMSAFAGIAACLALPGRSSADPLVRQVDRLAAVARKEDADPKSRRWLLTRGWLVALALMTSPLLAAAQVSVQIGLPGIDIGINQPVYPQLVQVPGYPVYYDPGARSNYFFYDGMYWVYAGDNWYASSWYDGPWALVAPQVVPVFLLRVPVRYYRHPPAYFRGWVSDAPPRWGDHWGNDWESHRRGWDRWDRANAPRPAPLPVYQREYSGTRYPHPEQQQVIRSQNYSYRARDAGVKQVERAQPTQRPAPQAAPPPAQAERKPEQPERNKQQAQAQQKQPQQEQRKQQAQPAPRPAPQAAPPPAQAERKPEQPERNKQQAQPQQKQQPQQEQRKQQAQPAQRPAPQAAPPPAQAERKAEQPERNKQQAQPQQRAQPQPQAQQKQQEQARPAQPAQRSASKDEGPKGNSAQARGQEHGPDRDR